MIMEDASVSILYLYSLGVFDTFFMEAMDSDYFKTWIQYYFVAQLV